MTFSFFLFNYVEIKRIAVEVVCVAEFHDLFCHIKAGPQGLQPVAYASESHVSNIKIRLPLPPQAVLAGVGGRFMSFVDSARTKTVFFANICACLCVAARRQVR